MTEDGPSSNQTPKPMPEAHKGKTSHAAIVPWSHRMMASDWVITTTAISNHLAEIAQLKP